MNIRRIVLLLCASYGAYFSAMEHSSEGREIHKQTINSQRMADVSCTYNKVDDLSNYAAYRELLPKSKFKKSGNNSAKFLFSSHNKKYVTTIDATNTLSIQDLNTEKVIFSSKRYDEDISADSWGDNSQYLILQKNDSNNTMVLYHPQTNKLLILEHTKPVTSFEWSNLNSGYCFLAAGLQDGSICIWNIEFKLCLVLPSPAKSAVTSVEWIYTKPGGDIIAFYENNTAYQWNMDSFFSFMTKSYPCHPLWAYENWWEQMKIQEHNKKEMIQAFKQLSLEQQRSLYDNDLFFSKSPPKSLTEDAINALKQLDIHFYEIMKQQGKSFPSEPDSTLLENKRKKLVIKHDPFDSTSAAIRAIHNQTKKLTKQEFQKFCARAYDENFVRKIIEQAGKEYAATLVKIKYIEESEQEQTCKQFIDNELYYLNQLHQIIRENSDAHSSNKSISSLLYNKLKRDMSYLAPHAFRLGVLAGTGYGLYLCIASEGTHRLTNYPIGSDYL